MSSEASSLAPLHLAIRCNIKILRHIVGAIADTPDLASLGRGASRGIDEGRRAYAGGFLLLGP
jgi:hypothetical protein